MEKLKRIVVDLFADPHVFTKQVYNLFSDLESNITLLGIKNQFFYNKPIHMNDVANWVEGCRQAATELSKLTGAEIELLASLTDLEEMVKPLLYK
jgi:hypothetical protein